MYMKVILLSLTALCAQHIFSLIYMFLFKGTIFNHAPGPCKYIAGVENGAEDMHTLANGLTFISSGYRVNYMARDDSLDSNGRILLYDMSNPNDQEIIDLELEGFDQSRFVPHGISAWQDNLGTITVFVVNHLKLGDQVESFRYQPEKKSLRHIRSFKDGSMRNLNDVLATSDKTFYFTNWSNSKSKYGLYMEALLLLPWTNVFYHDGEIYRMVAEDLVMANGLAMSNDGLFVYVACTMTRDVKVFRREADNSLTFHQEFLVDGLIDNLTVDLDGNIWAGLHPKLLSCMAHMENPVHSSPSQVLMLQTEDGLIKSMKEVYSNDGTVLSGSTVASYYGNLTLIGTLQEKLLLCNVRYI